MKDEFNPVGQMCCFCGQELRSTRNARAVFQDTYAGSTPEKLELLFSRGQKVVVAHQVCGLPIGFEGMPRQESRVPGAIHKIVVGAKELGFSVPANVVGDELVHRPASERMPPKFFGWANEIAAKFARPIYIVGTALFVPNPSEVSVRVVLADSEFEQRWGDPKHWLDGTWSSIEKLLPYAKDMAVLSQQAAATLRLNIDIRVLPLVAAAGINALRVDSVPGLIELRW